MKNKKATANRNILILIGVFIILAFYFNWFGLGSVINISSIDYSRTSLKENTANYLELQHDGIRNNPQVVFLNRNDCEEGKSYFSGTIPFKPQSMYAGYPQIATRENYWCDGWCVRGAYEWVDYIKGKTFEIQSAYVNGIELNDVEGSCQVIIQERPSDSTVADPNNFRNDQTQYWYYYTSLSCNYKGWIPCIMTSERFANFDANSKFSVNSKYVKITIPKTDEYRLILEQQKIQEEQQEQDETNDTAGNEIPTSAEKETLSTRFNNFIQSIIDWIKGSWLFK